LNRQILMTHGTLATARSNAPPRGCAKLNPYLLVDAVPENFSETNAERLVAGADVIVDCAPLFAERYLMNREAVRQLKPMVECAVYELEAHITTVMREKVLAFAVSILSRRRLGNGNSRSLAQWRG